MKKYKVQLEKFKKYHFSGEISRSGDFKKVPATKISLIDKWLCLMVGIVISNVFKWKNNET